MSRWVKVLFLFVTVCCFAGLVFPEKSTAQDKVFKLGILAPLTGPAAQNGTEIRDGATLAFEKIGSKIGDYKIELVSIDDQSDPAKGTNAYSEAIERKGVQAGILNWNTSVTVALLDVWAKYKVPHFFSLGAGKTINEKWASMPPRDRYLINKGWPVADSIATPYVELMNSSIKNGTWKPKQKLVALWGEDSPWGRSLVAGMGAMLKASGWKIFAEEYFPLNQTDFYQFLSKCKAAGVVALCGSSSIPAEVSGVVKQAREIGFHGLIVADQLGSIGDWYKLTGPASDGVIDMVPQISTPAQKEWAKEYKDRFGYNPSPNSSGICYDYANFFIKIAKRAIAKYGKLDSESLTAIGRDEVATGKLVFGKKDGALFNPAYRYSQKKPLEPVIGQDAFYIPVIQYNKGQGYIVYPENIKQATFVVK